MTESDNALIDALYQLSFLLQARLGAVAASYDLSTIQVRLLGILRDREPAMTDLARRLELEKSSLSGLIDRAEAKKLVERVPSPADGRGTTVRLTAQGKRLANKLTDEVARDVGGLFAHLPVKERQQLNQLVHRLLPT